MSTAGGRRWRQTSCHERGGMQVALGCEQQQAQQQQCLALKC